MSTIIVQDTFTGPVGSLSGHSPDIGNANSWIRKQGDSTNDIVINGGKCGANTFGQVTLYINNTAQVQNGIAQIDDSALPSIIQTNRIIFRWVDNATYYAVNYTGASAFTINITVTRVNTVLTTYAGVVHVNGATLVVTFVGANFTVKYNNAILGTTNDNTISTGFSGLGCNTGLSGGGLSTDMDNFLLTDTGPLFVNYAVGGATRRHYVLRGPFGQKILRGIK